MPRRIKKLRMSEVSGVDYPAHLANGFSVQKAADPDKSVAFLKALGRGIAMPTDEKIVKSLADATPEDIAEVAKAFTDEQKSEIAKALGVEAAPVSPEEALLKSLAPEAREVFKSLQAEVEKSAREASIEKARRLDTEAIAKSREEYQHLGFDHETVAPALRKMAETDPETAQAIVGLLKAVDAQAKEAELLKEIGTPGGGAETDAFNQIEKSALELQAADKTLSREAAISKALEAKPELFSQYRAELAQKGGI